jgi:hypothetical protein
MAPNGMTMRVASMRLHGHTFLRHPDNSVCSEA